jgi:cyclophilin family peptidyl-prolyl cis-trans isomerase
MSHAPILGTLAVTFAAICVSSALASAATPSLRSGGTTGATPGSMKIAKGSAKPVPFKSYADIIAAAPADAWRAPDLNNLVYLDIAAGRVVIELAPNLAPNHVENIRALIREKYFDGLAIVRSQDNYVVQWGEPVDTNPPKPILQAKKSLDPEFERKLSPQAFGKFAFDRLPDRDGYATEVGFASGFHAGRDPKTTTVWGAHCYGVVGVGRGADARSGSGASLYAITGHAPRHLDRNITVVGRVLQGMPLLSVLPRGTKALGFYATSAELVPIKSIGISADLPEASRTPIEVIRTDSTTFRDAVAALRNRGGDWFKRPAGYVELCNVPIAVRLTAK